MKNQEIKFKHNTSSYSIIIGKNTINILPKRIKLLCPKTKKIAVIVDKNIPANFKKKIKNKLKNYNFILVSFNASEKNKSIKSINYFLNLLLSKILTGQI